MKQLAGLSASISALTGAAPEIHKTVEASLLLHGLKADEVRVFLILGADVGICRSILAAAPTAIVYVLENRAASLTDLTLLRAAADPEFDVERIFVADLAMGRETDFDTDAYLAIVNFAAARGIPPSSMVVVDSRHETRTLTGIAAAVRDFVHHRSTRMLSLLADGETVSAELCFSVGRYLLSAGEPVHALKWLWLRAKRNPDHPDYATLSHEVGVVLAELEILDLAESWLQWDLMSDEEASSLRSEMTVSRRESQELAAETRAGNLEFLRERLPHVAHELERVAQDSDPPTYRVVGLANVPWRLDLEGGLRVRRDGYPLLLSLDSSTIEELNPPGDVGEVAAMLSKRYTFPMVVVGSWCQLGSALPSLVNIRDCVLPNYQPRVVLLETDVHALSLLCDAFEFRTEFGECEVRAYVGAGAVEDFVGPIRDDVLRYFPDTVISATPTLEHALQEAKAVWNAAGLEAQLRIRQFDQKVTPEAILKTIEAGQPLRILIPTSIYSSVLQYVAADLAAAFAALGHECLLTKERNSDDLISGYSLATQVASFQPEVVIQLDTFRPYWGPALPKNIPAVCWILDFYSVLKEPAPVRRLGPLDIPMFWLEAAARDAVRDFGYPRAGTLPFGVDQHGFTSRVPDDAADRVVFVTRVSPPSVPHGYGRLRPLIDDLLAIWDFTPHAILNLNDVLQDVVCNRGWQLTETEMLAMHEWGNQEIRRTRIVRIAEHLCEHGIDLALYGDGWDEIPNLARFARGTLDGKDALAQAYRENKVVLHSGTSMHSRVLEASLSGGFVVIRSECEVEDVALRKFFEVGTEIHIYHSDEELLTLVTRAFSDETWRRESIEGAIARVRKDHSYEARAEAIIEAVRDRLQAVIHAKNIESRPMTSTRRSMQ